MEEVSSKTKQRAKGAKEAEDEDQELAQWEKRFGILTKQEEKPMFTVAPFLD